MREEKEAMRHRKEDDVNELQEVREVNQAPSGDTDTLAVDQHQPGGAFQQKRLPHLPSFDATGSKTLLHI